MLGFSRLFSLIKNNVEFFDAVKNNVGSIASLVTVVSAVVGAYMYIDSAYVKAEDFKQFRLETAQVSQQVVEQQKDQIQNIRLQYLEDKIFELQAQGKLTPAQQAILSRYLRQREDLLQNRNRTASDVRPAH